MGVCVYVYVCVRVHTFKETELSSHWLEESENTLVMPYGIPWMKFYFQILLSYKTYVEEISIQIKMLGICPFSL